MSLTNFIFFIKFLSVLVTLTAVIGVVYFLTPVVFASEPVFGSFFLIWASVLSGCGAMAAMLTFPFPGEVDWNFVFSSFNSLEEFNTFYTLLLEIGKDYFITADTIMSSEDLHKILTQALEATYKMDHSKADRLAGEFVKIAKLLFKK